MPASIDGSVFTVTFEQQFRSDGAATNQQTHHDQWPLAILHHAFRLLAARGKARAGLGVDSESLTGATHLYEKAGMRVVRENVEYELLVRDGRDLRTLSLDPS